MAITMADGSVERTRRRLLVRMKVEEGRTAFPEKRWGGRSTGGVKEVPHPRTKVPATHARLLGLSSHLHTTFGSVVFKRGLSVDGQSNSRPAPIPGGVPSHTS